MAKKKVVKLPKTKSRLESPVHGMIGYGVLLALAIVVLVLVYSLQWYIIP